MSGRYGRGVWVLVVLGLAVVAAPQAHAGDKDLSLRMRAHGKQVLYVPACEVVHDRGQDAEYDATVRFRNASRMEQNVRDFERKWDCTVELVYSRTCLEDLGYAPQLIEDMVSGPLRDLFTVIDAV